MTYKIVLGMESDMIHALLACNELSISSEDEITHSIIWNAQRFVGVNNFEMHFRFRHDAPFDSGVITSIVSDATGKPITLDGLGYRSVDLLLGVGCDICAVVLGSDAGEVLVVVLDRCGSESFLEELLTHVIGQGGELFAGELEGGLGLCGHVVSLCDGSLYALF